MRRALVGLVLLVTLVGCTTGATLRTMGPGTPRPTAHATARSAPTPTRAPTPKPKPTPRPARVVAGKLSYQATACWDSDWIDSGGHQRGGVKVRFGLNVSNRGDVVSDPVWLMVTTDSDIGVVAFSPGQAGKWSYPGGLFGIKGPAVKPGDTARLSWSLVFFTPFDPHYAIDLLTARGSQAAYDVWLADEVVAYWSEWTSSIIC